MTFRPSQRGQEAVRSSWWVQLSWRDVAGWVTGNSPAFSTERDLTNWVRENRGEGVEVRVMRRDITDGGFKDVPLAAGDEPIPKGDPERLAAILAPLRAHLDAKRLEHRTQVSTPKGATKVEDRLRAQALAIVARAQAARGTMPSEQSA